MVVYEVRIRIPLFGHAEKALGRIEVERPLELHGTVASYATAKPVYRELDRRGWLRHRCISRECIKPEVDVTVTLKGVWLVCGRLAGARYRVALLKLVEVGRCVTG